MPPAHVIKTAVVQVALPFRYNGGGFPINTDVWSLEVAGLLAEVDGICPADWCFAVNPILVRRQRVT